MSVAPLHDQKTLASGSSDKTIRLWDLTTGTCVKTLKGHINDVNSVALLHDNKTLASGSDDKTIRLWDLASALASDETEIRADGYETPEAEGEDNVFLGGGDDY